MPPLWKILCHEVPNITILTYLTEKQFNLIQINNEQAIIYKTHHWFPMPTQSDHNPFSKNNKKTTI